MAKSRRRKNQSNARIYLKTTLPCNKYNLLISAGAVIGEYRPRGSFFETPGNLTGPKSYFEIKVSKKVGCVLTCNEVHFVSLAHNFTVLFSNLWKLPPGMENKKNLNRPGNYRELRETGPRVLKVRTESTRSVRKRPEWQLSTLIGLLLASPSETAAYSLQ